MVLGALHRRRDHRAVSHRLIRFIVQELTMPPQTRPFAYPTVAPSPLVHSSRTAAASAVEMPVLPVDLPFDTVLGEERWQEWRAKGRREAAAFREKTRVMALAVAVGLVAAAVYFVIIAG
jgi:hypothetical protein